MKKIILLTALTGLFCGCSNQENILEPIKSEPSELNVAVAVSNLAVTRTYMDKFITDSEIGILITGADYTSKFAKYKYDGTTYWNPPTEKVDRLILNDKTASVFGFYPADTQIGDGNPTNWTKDDQNKLTVDLPQNVNFDESNSKDYMYATSDPTKALVPITVSNKLNENRADLYFHHALSKLSFIINRAESYRLAGKLTQIKFAHANNIFMTGSSKMSLVDGTFTDGTMSNFITLSGTAIDTNPYDAVGHIAPTKVIASGLVVPIASTTGVEIILTVDGQELKGTIPTDGDGASWKPGGSYVYTVTVKDNSLNVATVSIVKWGDPVSISTEVN